MNDVNGPAPGRIRTSLPTKLAVAGVVAAAVVGGTAVATASASTTSSSYTVEAFRETVKPWDSISIPSLSCPTGYLEDVNLSPGRMPGGVQVIEPGAIGVTISDVKSTMVTDWWNKQHYPATGTDASKGFSTATNWDPFSSHELVIKLQCTTDLTKAYKDPSPYS